MWKRVEDVEDAALVIAPPWVPRLDQHERVDRVCYGVGKLEAAKQHTVLVASIEAKQPEHLVLYSDGSQMETEFSTDGRGLTAGGGWCLWVNGVCIEEKSIDLI